jgi:methionyl-tRNA formyltransferase
MTSTRIVYLGSKCIGLECLKILCELQEPLGIDIAGVLTNTRGSDIRDFCKERDLPVLASLEEYLETADVDIAISVQYHEILKKCHIAHAKLVVNLHMAPLPEYRGCNQFSFAILDGASTFGTTIHLLEEGIDSGAILAERRFAVKPNVWVEDLYRETFDESVLLFRESLPSLVSGDICPIAQEALLEARGTQFHLRREIEDIKKLDLSWSKEKLERHIRATYMPGFSPPYFFCSGTKMGVVAEPLSNHENPLR